MKIGRSFPLVIVAVVAVLGMAMAEVAGAQVKPGHPGKGAQVGQPQRRINGKKGGNADDKLMKEGAQTIIAANKILQTALPIYDGHRHMAMELDKLAVKDIKMGVKWSHQQGAPAAASAQQQAAAIKPGREENPNKFTKEQIVASNAKMVEAGQTLDKAIAILKSASPDYGGYRAQAIELAQQAQVEIKRGLAWISSHGG